jgi:3-methylcrotonyl-CoA carboxylase alpha subunit
MEFRYQAGDELKTVQIERSGDRFRVTVGGRVYTVEIERVSPGELEFSVEGQRRRAYIADEGQRRHVAFDANVFTLERAAISRGRRAMGEGDDSLSAAMPGQVVRVLVAEGEAVTRGQPLVLLEAMKMEIRVTAPHDGRIHKLLCSVGQIVERGQALLELSGA